MLVTPPALGKQLSLAVGLLRRLLKPFHLKTFGRDFHISWEDIFAHIHFQQRKESLKGEKSKTPPAFLMAAKKGLERACLVSERDTKKYSLALDR